MVYIYAPYILWDLKYLKIIKLVSVPFMKDPFFIIEAFLKEQRVYEREAWRMCEFWFSYHLNIK